MERDVHGLRVRIGTGSEVGEHRGAEQWNLVREVNGRKSEDAKARGIGIGGWSLRLVAE